VRFFVSEAVALRSFSVVGLNFVIIQSMHYVYILKSKKDNSCYKGVTEDLKKRIYDHNHNSNKYSSTKAPFELVWYCVFKEKRKAVDFEKYIKQGSGFAFARKRLI
jgi:putative endonuclease